MLPTDVGCHLLYDNKKLITDNHLQPAGGRTPLYVVFSWTIEFAVSIRGFSISPPSVAQVLLRAAFYLDCFSKTKWDWWVVYQKRYEGGCSVCRFVMSALLLKRFCSIFPFEIALFFVKNSIKRNERKVCEKSMSPEMIFRFIQPLKKDFSSAI